MKIDMVKSMLGKFVFYDTGQIDMDGCSLREYIFNACILRYQKKCGLFYQAELKELDRNAVIIVPLEKVLTKNEI